MPTNDEKNVTDTIETMTNICYDLLNAIRQHELTGTNYDQLLHYLTTENFNGCAESLGHVIHWTLQRCGMDYKAGTLNGKNVSKVRVRNIIGSPTIRELLYEQEPTIRGRLSYN